MTSDNASTNDKAMRILEHVFNGTHQGKEWLAKERHIR